MLVVTMSDQNPKANADKQPGSIRAFPQATIVPAPTVDNSQVFNIDDVMS